MLELLLLLLPIVITDALNPVLAAAVIFALGTPGPYRAAAAVLAGWLTVNLVAGAALVLGLGLVTGAAGAQPIELALQVPVAFGLVWFAYLAARSGEDPRGARRASRPTRSMHTLGPLAGILLGAMIDVVELPFALPYFAAVIQILKADLGVGEALVVLAIYNLAYLLPFAALVVLRFVYRGRSVALFERVNAGMEKAGALVLPLLLFVLGAVLLVDAVLFFFAGMPLLTVSPV